MIDSLAARNILSPLGIPPVPSGSKEEPTLFNAWEDVAFSGSATARRLPAIGDMYHEDDGLIHIVGGSTGSAVDDHDGYDSVTETYTALAAHPNTVSQACGASDGADVYVWGGTGGGSPSDGYSYNSGTNSWTTVESLPGARIRLSAIYLPGPHAIYVIAGEDNVGTVRDQIWKFAVSQQTFVSFSTKLATGRRYFDCGRISDTKFIVVAGQDDNNNSLSSCEIIDGQNDSRSLAKDYPVAVKFHGVSQAGGNIYGSGGRTPSESTTAKSYRYAAGDDTWTQIGDLVNARLMHLMAGWDDDALTPDTGLRAIVGRQAPNDLDSVERAVET